MDILKRVGLGAAIWAIIYVFVTILMFGFKLESEIISGILTWIVTVLLAWWLSGYTKIKDVGDAFVLGIIFVITGLILDYLGLVLPGFAPDIYSSWSLWVGYIFLLLTPIVKVSMAKK